MIREDKLKLEREAEKLDKELKTVIVPVIDKLGRACIGSCVKDGVEYMITYKPTYRTGISGDNLTRLEAQHKNIFDEFATKTESRRVFIKQRSV